MEYKVFHSNFIFNITVIQNMNSKIVKDTESGDSEEQQDLKLLTEEIFAS